MVRTLTCTNVTGCVSIGISTDFFVEETFYCFFYFNMCGHFAGNVLFGKRTDSIVETFSLLYFRFH